MAAAVLGVDSLRTDKDLTRRSRSPKGPYVRYTLLASSLPGSLWQSSSTTSEPWWESFWCGRAPMVRTLIMAPSRLTGLRLLHQKPRSACLDFRCALTFGIQRSSVAWRFRVFSSRAERALSTLLAQPAAYQTGPVALGFQLVWYDRTGKQISVLGNRAFYSDLELSQTANGPQFAF